MQRITTSEFVLILHSIPHLGPKGIARLISDLPADRTEKLCLDQVPAWRLSASELQREYRLHPEAALCLEREKDRLLKIGGELSIAVKAMGIQVITFVDADYPSALRDGDGDPPPVLYAHGNAGLLRERKYAVVGSTGVSVQGMQLIREFSAILSDEELTAVTSHNTEVYQAAGSAAKRHGAPILLVLDRGILSAFPRGLCWEPIPQARIWDVRFDPERDLVLSQFRLYDPWIGSNGRERDRMVFRLADVLVAVEVRSGGVMESECLRAHSAGREVYVCEPDDSGFRDGNRILADKGCRVIPEPNAESLLRTLDLLHEPVGGIFDEE